MIEKTVKIMLIYIYIYIINNFIKVVEYTSNKIKQFYLFK